MKIIVCSTSFIKRGAVADAVARIWPDGLHVESLPATSGVPRQPFGDTQILSGALHRVHEVAASGPIDCCLIAIENGVSRCCGQRDARVTDGHVLVRHLEDDEFMDLAYVVVRDLKGRLTITRTNPVRVPSDLVVQAQDSAWTMTCGQLEAARTVYVEPADPHVVWSGGKTHRRALLADAVEEALRSAFHTKVSS